MSKMRHNYGNIKNLPLTSRTQDGVLREIHLRLEKKQKTVIFTPNPEIVLHSMKNPDYMEIIRSSDILIADGIGLVAALFYLESCPRVFFPLKIFTNFFFGIYLGFLVLTSSDKLFLRNKNIKGRELVEKLVRESAKNRWKVFLLGGEKDEAEKAKKEFLKNYPSLSIESFKGPILDNAGRTVTKQDRRIENQTVQEIEIFEPDILIVGFGAPKQEYWINKWKNTLKPGVIIGAGGTFNYISGKSSLPPEIFQKVNLEWLWRLITDPKRIVRIYRAVIEFPFRVYLESLKN